VQQGSKFYSLRQADWSRADWARAEERRGEERERSSAGQTTVDVVSSGSRSKLLSPLAALVTVALGSVASESWRDDIYFSNGSAEVRDGSAFVCPAMV